MSDGHITVSVAEGVEDLIPTYMENRAQKLETLRAALGTGDLEQLCRLGHRMKGVGDPYGFNEGSALGKQIEDGAKVGDHVALGERIAEYPDFLARVRIVYK